MSVVRVQRPSPRRSAHCSPSAHKQLMREQIPGRVPRWKSERVETNRLCASNAASVGPGSALRSLEPPARQHFRQRDTPLREPGPTIVTSCPAARSARERTVQASDERRGGFSSCERSRRLLVVLPREMRATGRIAGGPSSPAAHRAPRITVLMPVARRVTDHRVVPVSGTIDRPSALAPGRAGEGSRHPRELAGQSVLDGGPFDAWHDGGRRASSPHRTNDRPCAVGLPMVHI
jgi:hypothetical protein